MNHREDTSHGQADNDTPPSLTADHTPVVISAGNARAAIATLNLLHQFFRHHASTAVHAELATFCALQGWHPVCGAQALLDDLGWHTLPLQRALDTITRPHSATSSSA